MSATEARPAHLEPETWQFYRDAMSALNAAGAPYLVGGAYAFERYTGIERHTKDFDIFSRREDAAEILRVLRDDVGCRTEVTFPHWLGKAYNPGTGDFVDVIYSSGSGIAVVDEEWFAHKKDAVVLGIEAALCPAEEIIWSKGFIMERERYDGNDIAHLLHACAEELDWERLLRRFGEEWRVLLSHLTLFGFVYPDKRANVPAWVMEELTRRLQAETSAPPAGARVCHGTLLSRAQYLVDIEKWGYEDARLEPQIKMTSGDIDHWTKAIGDQNRRREDHR
jgi:hypothetical protein